MKLRVWHIPQVPMDAFHVDVKDIETAKLILVTLANYDIFQFENNIKPDYSNMSGLQVLEGDEWADWEDGDCEDIWEVINHEDKKWSEVGY